MEVVKKAPSGPKITPVVVSTRGGVPVAPKEPRPAPVAVAKKAPVPVAEPVPVMAAKAEEGEWGCQTQCMVNGAERGLKCWIAVHSRAACACGSMGSRK